LNRQEENIYYKGWPDCIRLSNSEVEILIPTDIGLRILHFGFIGADNIFYLNPDDAGKRGDEFWRIYGGHRLWIAPESIPYHPDNNPVQYIFEPLCLKISQPVEKATGVIREMEISLSDARPELRVLHRIINQNSKPVKLAAWALSVLAGPGTAIIPQEPYGSGDDFLLPARSMALWSYTTMADPRWCWGNKYILAKQDPGLASEQKIGFMNKQGWVAYQYGNNTLIKVFSFDPAAVYPDYGSNNEIYINGNFLEIETLGPYTELPPGGRTEWIEWWQLSRGNPELSETAIDQYFLPRVAEFKNRIDHRD
jgi:hypothetical protein